MPPRGRRPRRTGLLRWAVLALTFLACGDPATDSTALLRLAEQASPRPVEGRLSGGGGYGPCGESVTGGRVLPSLTCSSAPSSDSRAGQALAKALRSARGIPPGRDPDFDHALGRTYLVFPDRLDPAISGLEAAAAAEPSNPAYLNDLAAALLARAYRDDRPADLARALDLVERAFLRAPDDPVALFNRALIVDRMGLALAAPGFWRQAEDADPDSPWGEEARRRAVRSSGDAPPDELARWAASLEEGLLPAEEVGRCTEGPARMTDCALEILFPAWAEADGNAAGPAAARRLDRLKALGEILARLGEPTAAEAVRALRAAGLEPAKAPAAAYVAYRRGAQARRRGEPVEAARFFDQAARLAGESGGSGRPLALWARFAAADARVTAGDPAGARPELEALGREPALSAYPALGASCAWSRGLIAVRGGAFAEARDLFAAAVAAYSRLDDPYRLGGARGMVAESLFALGLSEEAWKARREALATLGGRPSLSLHNVLLDAALAAHEDGLDHAALALREIDLEVAHHLGRPTTKVEARIWMGRTLADLERSEPAAAELELALADARHLSDHGLRARLVADAQEALAALLAESDPEAAVAALDEALPTYEASRFRWKVPAARFTRALAHQRLGHHARARADLEAAAAEFERRDRGLPPEIYRYHQFERAQAGFDAWIRLEAERGDGEAALVVAERARRVEMLAAGPPDAQPADPAQAVRRAVGAVPSDTAVIEYAVAGDRLYTWAIHRGRVRFLQRDAADLATRAAAFSEEIAKPAAAPERIAELADDLSADLVAPWIDGLPPGTRLVFAPDRFLHQIPFAALRDPRSGRWLADDFTVSTTPGLRFFAGLERPASPRRTRRGVLLVGDPAFDRAEAGDLPSLPGSAAEIAEIASVYPESRLLREHEATRPTVLAALAEAEIVHYAGHGVANPRDPWSSFLPFARPADGGTGLLLARDVHGLASGPWKVVVLSACGSTATAGRLRTAGFQALVHAFLAAGAEAVVASRWPVEDREIRPLAVELHRGLARGLGAAEALDLARKAFLRENAGSTNSWASFEVAGCLRPSSPSRRGVDGNAPHPLRRRLRLRTES